MTRPIRIISSLWLAILLLAFHCPTQAAEPVADSAKEIDTRAMEILRKATDYLSGLQRFQLKANVVKDVMQQSGQKLQFGFTQEGTVHRPNRLYGVRVFDDGSRRRFWYDGSTATFYQESQNTYAQIPVPDSIDGMLDYLETVMEDPHPLSDLLYSDLSFLLDLPTSAVYVGVSYIGGLACNHLAFRNEAVDWQVWVERGEKPLIRKIVITYKRQPGSPQLVAQLERWDTTSQFSDGLFRFSPPEGAQRIRVVLKPAGNTEKGVRK